MKENDTHRIYLYTTTFLTLTVIYGELPSKIKLKERLKIGSPIWKEILCTLDHVGDGLSTAYS